LTALSPGRTALRDLAILDAVDAHWGQTPHSATVGARGAAHALVSLDRRLRIEQAAEHGRTPDSLEGCIAVLQVAAEIAERWAPLL
jgi:hypothetical protein